MGTAIQTVPQEARMTVQEEWDYSNMVSQGSLLPDSYRGNPSNVMIAMGLGRSMGLSPMESLYRINVIKGKPTASAELITAQVRKAGHKLWLEKDEASLSVTAVIVRADDPEHPFRVTRDRAWAQSMGLVSKDNYRRQPLTMLTWRAITACAREACPEALYGVAYTPDELSDAPDARPAAREVQATSEPAARPAAAPQRNAGEYMRPVRRLVTAWRKARGLSMEQAMAELARSTGAASMQSMNAAQAARAVDLMREDLREPLGGAEPEEAEATPGNDRAQDAPQEADEYEDEGW